MSTTLNLGVLTSKETFLAWPHVKMGELEVACQVHCYYVAKAPPGDADAVVWPGPGLQPLSLQLADAEPGSPASEQAGGTSSCTQPRTEHLSFVPASLGGEEGFGTNSCGFSSILLCVHSDHPFAHFDVNCLL